MLGAQMTKRRLAYAWLAANLIGMGTYLFLASVLWVAPKDQGTPGGPGDAFVWFLTVVPVMLLFAVVNLIALYKAIKVYFQHKQLVPILLWIIVCSFWGNVLLFDHIKSMRFVDPQYAQQSAPADASKAACR
jgi:hypothetical protein